MLGYVKIHKDELKVKEYELYKGMYCSLCKSLGKNYGLFARLALSYDVTFLVLCIVAADGAAPSFKKGHCPFNPLKRCNYCTNADDNLNFASAITIMLTYFKILDNIADSTFWKSLLSRILLPWAKRKFKKAAKLYPNIALEISVAMNEQAKTERSIISDIDIAAHNSAHALGLIFKHASEKEALYNFGYSLGRWVYLTDALDDVQSDLKTGSFNVFVNKYQLYMGQTLLNEQKQQIIRSLNLSLSGAVNALEDGCFSNLQGIIENVLIFGTQNVINSIIDSKKHKQSKKGKADA